MRNKITKQNIVGAGPVSARKDSLNGDGGTSTTKDKNGLAIASGTDTAPFLPDNNSEIAIGDLFKWQKKS